MAKIADVSITIIPVETTFVISDDLFGALPVAAGQSGALQGNVVQLISEPDGTLALFHLLNSQTHHGGLPPPLKHRVRWTAGLCARES